VAIVAFEVMAGSSETAWLGKGLPSMLGSRCAGDVSVRHY
jgi:hypothetical protein